jgi:hypothetical protein
LARIDNNASSNLRRESVIQKGTILYVGDLVLIKDEFEIVSLAQILSLFGKSKRSKKEIDPSTIRHDPPTKKGQLSNDTQPFKSLVKLRFFNLASKNRDVVLFEDEMNPVWQYQPTKDVMAVIPPCRVSLNVRLHSVQVKGELLRNLGVRLDEMRIQRK